MSDLQRINDEIFPQAFALLPEKMDSLPARAMLLAMGLQESRFEHRVQIGGPAHGYWQFEKFGGVIGVLTHPSTRALAKEICRKRNVLETAKEVYQAIILDDVLACCFARLLLYTLPDKLPAQDHRGAAWGQYIAAWRPGAPRRHTWDALYDKAWLTVLGAQ